MTLSQLVFTAVLAAQSATSPVAVTRVSAPEKALVFDVVVPAPIATVWTAFTTKDGLQTWLWRDVRVALRPGGDWIVQFTPTATGGGTIESFTPERELVIRALAPEQFPVVRATRTRVAFHFAPVGAGATRITLIQSGWQTGAEWDAAYDYLAGGNAQLLAQLHQRFTTGPIAWPAPR